MKATYLCHPSPFLSLSSPFPPPPSYHSPLTSIFDFREEEEEEEWLYQHCCKKKPKIIFKQSCYGIQTTTPELFFFFFSPKKKSKRANTGDSMFLTTWKHAKKGKVNGNVHLFISTFTKWMKNNCGDWDRFLLLLWFFWFWNWNYLGAKNESSADELKSNQKPNQWRHERTWRGNNLKIPCIQLLKREYYPVITALSPAIESPTPKWKVSDSKLQFSR